MFNLIYYTHMGRCLARSSESHIVFLSIFLLSVPLKLAFLYNIYKFSSTYFVNIHHVSSFTSIYKF